MRLFIVEDDPRLLSSMSMLLDGEADVDVVGTAGSAEEALDTIEVDGCDVVLSDLGLPNMPGEELIRVLKRRRPELEIVAYTVFDDRDSVFGALKAGASGYLLKSSTPRELVEGLTLVSRGGAPMSPRIARAVVTEFHDNGGDEPTHDTLTPRERQVLNAIDQGFTYKEIAADLGLSHHTVHGYVKAIYEKLHARGRREAVRHARRRGLI
ncbi:MAG: response regulator transcription factor [Polyangiaceae bacterium]